MDKKPIKQEKPLKINGTVDDVLKISTTYTPKPKKDKKDTPKK